MLKRKENETLNTENNNEENSSLVSEPSVTFTDEKETDNKKVKEDKNPQKLTDSEGFAISSDDKITISEDSPDYAKDIEKARIEYNKERRVFKYISYVILGFSVLAIIILFVFAAPIKDYGIWICLGSVVFLLVLIYLYNSLSKKHLIKKATEYIKVYYNLTNEQIFDDKEHFSDISVDTNGIVDKEIIATSRIYKNVENIGARNLITFKYNNIESNKVLDFTLSDVGLQRRGEKRMQSVFVGKIYYIKHNLQLPGRALLQCKSESDLVYKINDVDDLESIIESNKTVLFSNLNKIKAIFTASIINKIESFKYDNSLLDVVISISKDYIFIGLDYNDDIMSNASSLDKGINYDIIERLKEENLKAVEIISELQEKLEKNYNNAE
ncbi:MAG: hypothetical protein IAA85_04440 [Firmicutes bacterium]|nr:hypothetical protein [Candidatus Alectryobacillus merdavium]